MGEDTDKFEACIDKLHEKTEGRENGISSTMPHCRYRVIKAMTGLKIRDIPDNILSESNFDEYMTSRYWNRESLGGCFLETLLIPLRKLEYLTCKADKKIYFSPAR